MSSATLRQVIFVHTHCTNYKNRSFIATIKGMNVQFKIMLYYGSMSFFLFFWPGKDSVVQNNWYQGDYSMQYCTVTIYIWMKICKATSSNGYNLPFPIVKFKIDILCFELNCGKYLIKPCRHWSAILSRMFNIEGYWRHNEGHCNNHHVKTVIYTCNKKSI